MFNFCKSSHISTLLFLAILQLSNTSIVPALCAGIIHNDKQWELYHLYL